MLVRLILMFALTGFAWLVVRELRAARGPARAWRALAARDPRFASALAVRDQVVAAGGGALLDDVDVLVAQLADSARLRAVAAAAGAEAELAALEASEAEALRALQDARQALDAGLREAVAAATEGARAGLQRSGDELRRAVASQQEIDAALRGR